MALSSIHPSISVPMAETCAAVAPPKVASPYSDEVVNGKPSLTARLKPDVIEMPPNYRDHSCFAVQGQKAATVSQEIEP